MHWFYWRIKTNYFDSDEVYGCCLTLNLQLYTHVLQNHLEIDYGTE